MKMVSLTISGNTTVVLCKAVLLVHAKGSKDVEEIDPPQQIVPDQAKQADTKKTKPSCEVRKSNFLCAGISKCETFLAAASDDKKLSLWHKNDLSGKWNVLTSREVLRKCIRIQFNHNGSSVLVADRGGDVYDFSVVNPHEEGVLLLGHLSMLLDLLITPDDKYVITCDRDDKIRVSHYPNAYSILTYCLGHTEFISSLCLCGLQQRWLISGSGDGTIRIWTYQDGKELFCHRYAQETEKPTENGTIWRLCCSSDGHSVAAMFQGSSDVTLYKVSATEGPTLTNVQTVALPAKPWDLQFDKEDILVILVATVQQMILVYKKDDLGQFNQAKTEKSLDAYNHLNDHASTHCDLYKKIMEEERSDFSFLQKQWFDNVQQYLEKKRKRQEQKKTSKKINNK